MIPRVSHVLAVLLLIGVAACATARDPEPGVSSDRIVIAELSDDVAGLSAYQVVEQHRPQWLRKRGEASVTAPRDVQVYLDKNRSPLGPPSTLRRLPAMDVDSIVHLSASEAQAEYGLNNVQGAIVVYTKNSRDDA